MCYQRPISGQFEFLCSDWMNSARSLFVVAFFCGDSRIRTEQPKCPEADIGRMPAKRR
jgi:hypothetical protein